MHPRPGVHERILLHLRDYVDYAGAVEVPFSLSQMGIANAVAIARSNVPRAIAGLKDQGLLIERQAHVSGVTRKRKAYFLTESGVEASEEVWERLSLHPVRLILQDGATASSTLAGVGSQLPFAMRPVDVLRYLDDVGVLDLRLLNPELIERDLSKHVEKQLVTSLADLPRLRHFYGRERELEHMESLLEARSTCMLVPGIAGIGKTSLAAKLLERFTHRRNLLYHRCQDWEGARSFLEAAADWLGAIGDSQLADYLAATPVPRPSEAVRQLVSSLDDVPALIVIDDYHKVSDEALHTTIRSLALQLGAMEDVGLVVFTRSYAPVLPLEDAEGNIATLIYALDGLDTEAGRQLLTALENVDDVRYLQIHSITRGHPLALELINRGASSTAYHETLERYVEAEIFARLSGGEQRLLGGLAIFREPIPLDALDPADVQTDTLDRLVERGLARIATGDEYDVHDLVREFLLRTLGEATQVELHRRAAEWYRERTDQPEGLVEYLHHLRYCGDHDEVAQRIIEHGQALVRRGQMELLSIIASIDRDEVSDTHWSGVQQLRGDLLTLQGEWDEAEQAYLDALDLVAKQGEPEAEARLLASLADILVQRGRVDEALDHHRKALTRFIELGDARWAARSYSNMGYIFRRKGDKNAALESYANVEHVLADSQPGELVDVRINLARAFLEMQLPDRAREHALQAFDEAQAGDDEVRVARARAVLGRYYSSTGDADLARHHYAEALEQLGHEGDPRSVVEITLLLGEVLIAAGQTEDALERYREGLAMAEANDFRLLSGELLARLGGAASDRQRRTEYLQRALTIFRELGAKDRMQEVQMQVHRAIMGR